MRKYILSAALLLSVAIAADARKVGGKVHCGSKALSGVIVTDGTSFTRTNRHGSFKFDIADSAKFVYVVTPSGYVADYSSGSPEFYREAEGCKAFDFDLQKTASQASYTLFSISDPQMKTSEHFGQFCAEPFENLKEQGEKYSKQGAVVGIMLGDIAWDLTEIMVPYKEKIATVGYPVYHITGNHDYDKRVPLAEYSHDYYANFGPHNYAFFMGQDLVICVNNIIYEKEKAYYEGYSDEVLGFVKNLLAYVPKDTHIFFAHHSPIRVWWKSADNGFIPGAHELLSILDGYKVDMISGHTHVMNNYQISGNVYDHNAASICASWWTTKLCRDGSPYGFEIFNVAGKDIRWHYHTIGRDEDYQVEIIPLGQSKFHPNCVVANIWDYDDRWSITWEQDGKDMGAMKMAYDVSPEYIRQVEAYYAGIGRPLQKFRKPFKSNHYFAAEPSQYAKTVTVHVKSRFGQEWKYDIDLSGYVDVQAHRGGAGLWPENTLTSMTNATFMGVNTLEMDLQISSDGQIVVSHDAFFHSRYSTRPDGTEVKADDPKEYLYTMPYDSIAKYDVGKRVSTVWPEKGQVPEIKPLASVLIDSVENYTRIHGLSPMRYNIEIKSKVGKTEGNNWPEYHEFVDKCVELLLSKNLGDRLVVQCFDVRALNYMHEKYPQLKLSYLTDKKDTDWDTFMGKLNFTPDWLSPHFSVVDATLVENCHKNGIKIVPWTVDEPADIQRMIDLNVDAIISNYPDRLLGITRGYME